MGVCMGVCAWECVHVRVCMGVCAWEYVHVSVHVSVYMGVCMGVCAWEYVHVSVHGSVHGSVWSTVGFTEAEAIGGYEQKVLLIAEPPSSFRLSV